MVNPRGQKRSSVEILFHRKKAIILVLGKIIFDSSQVIHYFTFEVDNDPPDLMTHVVATVVLNGTCFLAGLILSSFQTNGRQLQTLILLRPVSVSWRKKYRPDDIIIRLDELLFRSTNYVLPWRIIYHMDDIVVSSTRLCWQRWYGDLTLICRPSSVDRVASTSPIFLFYFVFVNMGPYGSKNFKTLLLP